MGFISIHALRGEGDVKVPSGGGIAFISIHALRGEGDAKKYTKIYVGKLISIHALRGEGDYHMHAPTTGAPYFYPRPPWGGRP